MFGLSLNYVEAVAKWATVASELRKMRAEEINRHDRVSRQSANILGLKPIRELLVEEMKATENKESPKAINHYSVKAAKKLMSRLSTHGVMYLGTVRPKAEGECFAKSAIGSEFLIGVDGQIVWARPKPKELSIWSQC